MATRFPYIMSSGNAHTLWLVLQHGNGLINCFMLDEIVILQGKLFAMLWQFIYFPLLKLNHVLAVKVSRNLNSIDFSTKEKPYPLLGQKSLCLLHSSWWTGYWPKLFCYILDLYFSVYLHSHLQWHVPNGTFPSKEMWGLELAVLE